jgi:DNA-binding transcriptional LysR family regulator
MDHFKAMRTFVQVADVGSFVGASRALDISPAVVTRVVADLENDLGARLLTRTTRRVALTDIGSRFLERARSILSDLDDAQALARHHHQKPRGAVKLRAPGTFAAGELGPRLPRFLAAHPELSVALSTSDTVDGIDEAQDLTLVMRREPLQGGFIARRLARSEVLLCASPEYLDAVGRPLHPQALVVGHRLLLPPSDARRPLMLQPRQGGQAVTVVAPPVGQVSCSDSLDVQRAAALGGLGIAALPSHAVHEHLRDGRLVRVLADWHLHDLTLWACLLSRRHLPASTRALLDFLLQAFGGRDEDPWLASVERKNAAEPDIRPM